MPDRRGAWIRVSLFSSSAISPSYDLIVCTCWAARAFRSCCCISPVDPDGAMPKAPGHRREKIDFMPNPPPTSGETTGIFVSEARSTAPDAELAPHREDIWRRRVEGVLIAGGVVAAWMAQRGSIALALIRCSRGAARRRARRSDAEAVASLSPSDGDRDVSSGPSIHTWGRPADCISNPTTVAAGSYSTSTSSAPHRRRASVSATTKAKHDPRHRTWQPSSTAGGAKALARRGFDEMRNPADVLCNRVGAR